MQIHDTIVSLRSTLAKEPDKRVGFVPTMGNLHDGHIALMTQARDHANIVVASIFVNRLQFRPGEDFEKYPRTFQADCERMAAAGVDHLFAPNEAEMYPQAQTYHIEPPPEQACILDGEFRPGHFRGVATVVMKLFQIVQPHVALFGKKDFQQLMVIRNMVNDFNLPIEIIGGETVRAPDGLALSSRNGYLTTVERAEAPRIFAVISKVVEALQHGNRDYAGLEQDATDTLLSNRWLTDYVAVRKKSDLQLPPAQNCSASELVVLAAARLGNTRLIDNLEA